MNGASRRVLDLRFLFALIGIVTAIIHLNVVSLDNKHYSSFDVYDKCANTSQDASRGTHHGDFV